MTNYNDGKWHGWNGEELKPASVHDNSVIEFIWHDENTDKHGCRTMFAGRDERDHSPAWGHVLKFRVTKEHKEPREFWLTPNSHDPSGFHVVSSTYPNTIHVREVLT